MTRPVILIATLLSASVFATGAPGAPREAGGRIISGVVLSASSGQPLAQADVTLYDSRSLRLVVEGTTDGEGRFAFQDIPDGRYRLSASHRGYLTSAYQEHAGGISTNIVTGEDLDTTNLELTLLSPAAIYGTVTEDSGDPVPQARIRIYALDPGAGRMRPSITSMADVLGHFDLPNLAPGVYYLCASGTPWYAQPALAGPPGGVRPASLDMAYRTGCNPDGADPAGAEPVTVNPGDSLPLDLVLHPVPAVHISLQIPHGCGGNTIVRPDVHEQIFGRSELVTTGFSLTCQGDPQDGNSTATLYGSGIAPGEYEIELVLPPAGEQQIPMRVGTVRASSDDPQGPIHSRTVDASSGELTLDPSSLATLPSLSGTVAAAGGSGLPAFIRLVPASMPADDSRFQAKLGSDGSFRMNGVPAGRYEVKLSEGGHGPFAVDRISARGARAQGRMVEIGNGPATLSITAEPADAVISGSVGSGGRPAPGVLLLLVPVSPGFGGDPLCPGQSDSDGSFELRQVAPGDYVLVAIEQGWTLAWDRPEVIRPYLDKGVPVSVTSSSARISLRSILEAQPQAGPAPPGPPVP